jgi:hypothetical protein
MHQGGDQTASTSGHQKRFTFGFFARLILFFITGGTFDGHKLESPTTAEAERESEFIRTNQTASAVPS